MRLRADFHVISHSLVKKWCIWGFFLRDFLLRIFSGKLSKFRCFIRKLRRLYSHFKMGGLVICWAKKASMLTSPLQWPSKCISSSFTVPAFQFLSSFIKYLPVEKLSLFKVVYVLTQIQPSRFGFFSVLSHQVYFPVPSKFLSRFIQDTFPNLYQAHDIIFPARPNSSCYLVQLGIGVIIFNASFLLSLAKHKVSSIFFNGFFPVPIDSLRFRLSF